MRGTWKIAALLAGWTATGLAGCANDTEDPPAAAIETGNDGEIAAPGVAHEPLSWTYRPPSCPRNYQLVEVVGRGFRCRDGDLLIAPYCMPPYQLHTRGAGYVCRRPVW